MPSKMKWVTYTALPYLSRQVFNKDYNTFCNILRSHPSLLSSCKFVSVEVLCELTEND